MPLYIEGVNIMSLENGILGFLAMKPMSGYDLKKVFDISASYFWPANQSQIYRTLRTLENDEMIVPANDAKDEPQGKQLYAITEKGREAYYSSLFVNEVGDFVSRDRFLMQLFFSGALSEEEQLNFLDAQLEDIKKLEQMLIENYDKNLRKYLYTTGLDMSDPRFKSSLFAQRWGLIKCREYAKLLEEIKTELDRK